MTSVAEITYNEVRTKKNRWNVKNITKERFQNNDANSKTHDSYKEE